ncbi:hypothetical protein CBP31_12055 [Oceanisphaera profunda]|uniref:DUF4760 domain-containing protein n=1 Tax=Oceanisphaera profunda TaxID=1416627 RepID=A0A1Y0D6T7_9GAMM|nr:hypothetical protein [Oceanisphaera profunda]ART83263.1 hypothetical protein CBP31_12055 [Oceanisphaera profunda]
MDPQWVIATASSVAALGIIVVIFQAKVTVKQLNTSIQGLKSDHERSRRERAIELLRHWDSSLTLNSVMARKFAETLEFNQSKCLLKQQPFKISSEHYGLFVGSLSSMSARLRDEGIPKDKLQVTEREFSEIRWAVISYLNLLETVLTAVRHNIADKEMLYEQFTYLVSPSEGHYILEDFRNAAGGSKTYPSIEAF